MRKQLSVLSFAGLFPVTLQRLKYLKSGGWSTVCSPMRDIDCWVSPNRIRLAALVLGVLHSSATNVAFHQIRLPHSTNRSQCKDLRYHIRASPTLFGEWEEPPPPRKAHEGGKWGSLHWASRNVCLTIFLALLWIPPSKGISASNET